MAGGGVGSRVEKGGVGGKGAGGQSDKHAQK